MAVQFVLHSGPAPTATSTDAINPIPSSSSSSSSSSSQPHITSQPSHPSSSSSSSSHSQSLASSSSSHPRVHVHASPLRRSTRLHHPIPLPEADGAVPSGLVGPEVDHHHQREQEAGPSRLRTTTTTGEKEKAEKRKTRKRARSTNFEAVSDGEGLGEEEGKGKGKMVASTRTRTRTSSGEDCADVKGGEGTEKVERRTTRHTRSKSNPEGCFGGKKKVGEGVLTPTAPVVLNGTSHDESEKSGNVNANGKMDGDGRRGRGAKRVRLSVDDKVTSKGKGKGREEGEGMVVESPEEESGSFPESKTSLTTNGNVNGTTNGHNPSPYSYGYYPYRLYDAEGSLSPPPTLTPSPPPEDVEERLAFQDGEEGGSKVPDSTATTSSSTTRGERAPMSSSSTGSVIEQNGQEERARKRRRTRSSVRAEGLVDVEGSGSGSGSGESVRSGSGEMEVDDSLVVGGDEKEGDVQMGSEDKDAGKEKQGAGEKPVKRVGRGKRKRVEGDALSSDLGTAIATSSLTRSSTPMSTPTPVGTPKRTRGSGRSGIKKAAVVGRRKSGRGVGRSEEEGEGMVVDTSGETQSAQQSPVQAPHSIIQTRAAKLRSKTKDSNTSPSAEPEASASSLAAGAGTRGKSKTKSQSRSPPVDLAAQMESVEGAVGGQAEEESGNGTAGGEVRRRRRKRVDGNAHVDVNGAAENGVVTRRRKAKAKSAEEGGDAMLGVVEGEGERKKKAKKNVKAGRKRMQVTEDGPISTTTPATTSMFAAPATGAVPTPQQSQRQQRAQQRQLRQMQKAAAGGAGGKIPPPPTALLGKRVAVPALKLQAEGLTPLSSLSSLSSLSPPSSPTNGSSSNANGGGAGAGGGQQVQYRPPNPITTPPIAHGSTMPTVHSPLTPGSSLEKIGGVVGTSTTVGGSASGSGGSTPSQGSGSATTNNGNATTTNPMTEPPSAPGSPCSSTASLAGSPTSTSPHTLSPHTSHSLSAHALTLLHTHTPPSSPPHSPNLGLWRGSGSGMGAGGGVGGPPLDAVDVGPLLPLSLGASGTKEGGGSSVGAGGNGNTGSLVGRKDLKEKEREVKEEEVTGKPLTPMSVLGISVKGLMALDVPSGTSTSTMNSPAPTSTTNTPVGSPVMALSTISDAEQPSTPQSTYQALSSTTTTTLTTSTTTTGVAPPASSALFAIPPPLPNSVGEVAPGSTSPITPATPLSDVATTPSSPTPPPAAPVPMPMTLASESEIGFGFQPQEGFLSAPTTTSAPDVSNNSATPTTPSMEGVDMNVDSAQPPVQPLAQEGMGGVTSTNQAQQQQPQQQHQHADLGAFGMFDALGGANGIGSGLVGMVGVGGVDSPFGVYHHQAPDIQRDGEQQQQQGQAQGQTMQQAQDPLQPQTQQDGPSDALQYSFFSSLSPLPSSVGSVTLAGGLISGHHHHPSLHHHHESSGSHENAQAGQSGQGGEGGMLLDPMGLQMGGMGDMQMGGAGGSGAGNGGGASEMGGIALPVPLPVPMFPSVSDNGSGGGAGDGSGFGVVGDGMGMQVDQQQQQQQMDQQQQQMRQHQLQQQQQHQPPQQTYSNQMLNARAHRRVEYQPPRPLEEAPLLNKDGSMWKIACKLRVWEITKRYSPDTIRSVVAQDAHDYFVATGRFPIGYGLNASSSKSRWGHHHSSSFNSTYGNNFGRFGRSKLGMKRRASLSSLDDRGKTRSRSHTPTPDGETGAPSPDAALSPTSSSPPLSPGEDEDFMYEKIYPFELLDDDSTDDALSPLSPTGGVGDMASRPVASIGGIVVDPRWAEEYDEDETDEDDFDEEDEDDDETDDDDDDDDDDETEGEWEEGEDMDIDIEGFEDIEESDEEVAGVADGVKTKEKENVVVVEKEGEEVKEGPKVGEGETGQITGAILGKGLLSTLKGKAKAVAGIMKGKAKTGSRSGSPATDSPKADNGAISGGKTTNQEEDPDAEGEMEVDIEPFSDPSFNAELSSPTSPTAEALPINSSPGGTMSSFYIPTVPGGNGGMNVGGFFGSGPSSPASSPSADPTHVRQEPPPLQIDQQPQNIPEQQQGPLQIQLPPPVYHIPPPMPILPLPPPRLDTIRVAWLRSTELGVKLTGRGTPADRERAEQWAKGWTGYPKSSTTSPLGDMQEGGIAKDMGDISAGKSSSAVVDSQLATAQSQWDELLAGLRGTSSEATSTKSDEGLRSEMVVTPSNSSASNINESIADPALRPATPQPDPTVSSTAATSSADGLGINMGLFDMGGMNMNIDMGFVGNMMVDSPTSPSSPTTMSSTMETGNNVVNGDPSWFTQSSQDGLQQSHQLGHTTPMSMRIQSGPGTESYVDSSPPSPHATSGTSTLSFALG